MPVRTEILEILIALAAFGVLCAVALSVAPQLSEPDDYAYRGSVVGVARGHLVTLSDDEVNALAADLSGPRMPDAPIPQWVRLSDGRWISEKDPGYPLLAGLFERAGIIRLAPLFFGALGCLGLFIGARRWLGRYGGAAAVGLFCSSGAALLFAWRDYMPTFTEASLIAAGTGALLWAVLAVEAGTARRTWVGLLAFLALEAAVFVRYTDIVILGCAVVAVLVARPPRVAVLCWLASVALVGEGIALFNTNVFGGPLTSGYPPGKVSFGVSAIGPNLHYLSAHLITAMPMLVLGLVAGAWITLRRVRPGHAEGTRRDFAVALALGASWLSVWGLYATYTWTAVPGHAALQTIRFYTPAVGAIALLGAWLLVNLPLPARPAVLSSTVVIVALFGLGVWSFTDMHRAAAQRPPVGPSSQMPRPGG